MEQERWVRVKAKEIQDYIRDNAKRGTFTHYMANAANILLGQDEVSRFYECCRRGEILEIPLSALYRLAEAWDVADIEKFAGALVMSERQTYTLPSGDARRGEIEVIQWGENVIADQKYNPTNKYVAVYVDAVRFRQIDEESGKVIIKAGKYIRIEPPSGLPGAVVLPVDSQSGDVLLVQQYRHPQRRFLTEAPRGFGMPARDPDPLDTARREMAEETGAVPFKKVGGIEEWQHLRALYTDTGQLAHCPHYFLVYVDRRLQLEALNRQEPTMEDPVWVSLPAFYRAVETDQPIQLQPHEYKLCLKVEYREKLNARTPLDDGILKIEDAFTCLVALLAKPYLVKRYHNLFQI
jgi:8-oxo-dGTP pyrophosphatase MutT (NUDIX family)